MQVQQVYSVTITLPLTLAAANLTAAQAQAERITASSSALANALATGLIAGSHGVCAPQPNTMLAVYNTVIVPCGHSTMWTIELITEPL